MEIANDTNTNEQYKKYPENKLFKIIDTIGIPHPYCITPKHLQYANIYLDKEAILRAEENGARCDICAKRVRKKLQGRILRFDEHEKGLLVEVDAETLESVKAELHAYLLSIKEQANNEGYVGFAFLKKRIDTNKIKP